MRNKPSLGDTSILISTIPFITFAVVQYANMFVMPVDSHIVLISWYLLGIGILLAGSGMILKRQTTS